MAPDCQLREAEPLYPAFVTGWELIRLFADGKRAPDGQVNLLLGQLGAGSFVEQTAGTYSSGMRKKLSLVLAFVGQPAVILLDEPLITLDHAAVEAVYRLMEDCLPRGITLLVSSHQAFESGKLDFTSVLRVEDRTVSKE
ncbi:MAG: AAA family ATPase [Ferruginibacter sp.]|nr:AAA family ATPase [Cytophagales bacterium]